MTDQELQKFKTDTEDTITKLKGQIDDQDNKIKELNLKLDNANRLISANIKQGTEESYDFLRVYRLYGGIPIVTTTTNLRGFPGQHFLINAKANTTPRKLVGYQIGNTVSTVALT